MYIIAGWFYMAVQAANGVEQSKVSRLAISRISPDLNRYL